MLQSIPQDVLPYHGMAPSTLSEGPLAPPEGDIWRGVHLAVCMHTSPEGCVANLLFASGDPQKGDLCRLDGISHNPLLKGRIL